MGTFDSQAVARVGIVLRDGLIVDIEAANAAFERTCFYPSVPPPRDMIDLIERYDYVVKRRLYEIVNDLVANNRLGGDRQDYIHRVEDVRTLCVGRFCDRDLRRA